MKATFAPLTTKKKEPVTLAYSRESIYDSSLVEKYSYLKRKGIPAVPKVIQRKTAYTRANEIPFVEFQPSTQYMSKFLVADDSGDSKDEKTVEATKQKRNEILNNLYSAKLQREIVLMNQEYMEWKSFYSEEGPSIRWTGEVSYYGSYILFNIALKFTPQFFTAIFFKSGMYKTAGGRFFITQFLEQVLNIRAVEPFYKLLNEIATLAPNELEGNAKYQALLTKMVPGSTSLFPIIQGTLAIGQSFFRQQKIPFSRLFMKNLPLLLASPTINYYAATLIVSLAGPAVPVIVCQLAASVMVQFISGQVTKLTQAYFFADLAKLEEEEQRKLARDAIEQERKDELALRRKYVEIGIVGKDIDDRIKMKFDWEGNFGKNIAKFQDGLYKAWKTRGKAMPMFGSVGFNALLSVWGVSTIAGFIMFTSTNDFQGYQLATGENIGWRFMLDFATTMLRSFRFFDGMFSVEALALPVVQKLRNDLIRIFSELAADIFSDMKSSASKVLTKAYYSSASFNSVNRLQKQSAFAYYFYTAMEKILDTVSKISDPAFRLILENYLNLAVPMSQNIVSNMFRFSIENSLSFFESMNLFFLQFGVAPMTTSQGQISFYDTVLRGCTKGRYSNRAQMLYKPKTDEYSLLKPGTILGDAFRFFSIQIPKSFAGYEENLALLPLPHRNGEKVTFLDVNLNSLPTEQRAAVIQMWNQIGVFQKVPAIFNFFLEGVSSADLKDPAKMRDLFTRKMNEPETKRLFDSLQIPLELRGLITPEIFIKFAGQYETFLQNALDKLNGERKPNTTAYTLDDIKGGNLNRTTMSRFSDLFADEYSQYVTDLVYQNVPLFTSFTGSFRHSYKFMEGADVRYHNFVVQRNGEAPPEGYTAYTLDKLSTDVLNPSFFKRKLKVKKPGTIVNGEFVYNPEQPLIDVDIELNVPESSIQEVSGSFEMLSRMGYTIYYKKDTNGIDGAATQDATADNLSGHFSELFTSLVRKSLPAGNLGEWKVSFFNEGPYLGGGNTFYSAEANVLQIGANTHFFYSWTKHAGLRNLVYPPGYKESVSEGNLRRAYNNGLLQGEYLQRYQQLAAARSFNTAAGERVKGNRASALYALDREYERLGLRTMDETHMFELFRSALQADGDPTMLSGENPDNLNMGTIFGNIMSNIGPGGMFPDGMVPIYGSDGGRAGPLVGTYESASREGSWFLGRTYQPVSRFYQDANNRIRFQRMLAYTLHGWFTKDGNPATYKSILSTTTPTTEWKSEPADLSLLGTDKNPDSLDFNAYGKKLNKSPNSKNLRDLEEGGIDQDDFITFLKFLYLVTDDEGKISVPDYERHLNAITEPVDKDKPEGPRKPRPKAFQITYIDEQLRLLENSGKKRPNFVGNCLLGKENCYTYKTPREIQMSVGIHSLFQIDYYLHGLGIKNRVMNGKGIQNHEVYNGQSPYFNSGRKVSNIAQFYFGSDIFMGLSFSVLDNFSKDSDQYETYQAWETKAKNLKRNKILSFLRIRADSEIAEKTVTDFLSLFEKQPGEAEGISDYLIERFNNLPGSSPLRYLFGTPEKRNEFIASLQSADMLNYFTSGGEFDEIRGLITTQIQTIEADESTAVRGIEDRRSQVVARYDSEERAIDDQRIDIENQLGLLWDAYDNDGGVADIPALRPIEAYRPPPTPVGEPAAAAAPARPGGEEQVRDAGPRLGQKPAPPIQEGLVLANRLAQAERQANIERLRNELSQSQSQAQREDIRLRLMNAYIEIFGGDTSYFASLSDTELSDFVFDTGLFPEAVGLKGPEPQPFPNPNLPFFQQCALESENYDLQGATGVRLKNAPAGEQNADAERFLACRTQAVFVGGTKTVYNTLFNLSEIMGQFGGTAVCIAVSTALGGIVGLLGGPVGALKGAAQGFAYSSIPCKAAAQIVVQIVLPNYIKTKVVGKSNMLKALDAASDDPDAKIRVYEQYFDMFQRELADPNTTAARANEIREEIKFLYTMLIFESHYSGDNPLAAAFTFTSTLFGVGKSSHFNYNPFFKPSAEQIAFLNNLGVFDFSNIRKPEDLLEAIKGTRLNLNDATLTVLFGQKYKKPEGEVIDYNPSYNIWYRIGETIQALDNFDTRNAVPGQKAPDGNLFTVMTGTVTVIRNFFNGGNKEINDEITRINTEADEAEQAEARRREANIRSKPRVYDTSSFFTHIFSLVENINLSDEELNSDLIQRMPVLVENNAQKGTFFGYGTAENVTSAKGISGPLDVHAIGGTENNSRWKDKTKISDDDRKQFRSLFATSVPGYGIPYYNKKESYFFGLIPSTSRKEYHDIYEQMYEVMDNVPEDLRIHNFFSPIPTPIPIIFPDGSYDVTYQEYEAWVPGEKEHSGYQRPPTLNMHDYGNIPPFLFMTAEEWDNKPEQTRNEAFLNRYYVRQSTKITFPDGTVKDVYGWFLQEDIDVFATMQPPSVEGAYTRVNLIDAVLNNAKFRATGVTGEVSLFLEKEDKPLPTDSPEEKRRKYKKKWIKSLLLRFIFSTTNNTLRGHIEFGKYEDTYLGESTPTVTLYTVERGVEIGMKATGKKFFGEIQGAQNVHLRALARQRQKRRNEGTEVLTDLDEKTRRELSLFSTKITEAPGFFDGIDDTKRDAATQVLNGVLSLKLGVYIDSRKENESISPNDREVFRTNAPTLTSIGNQSIAAARAALGDDFQAIFDRVLANIGAFADSLDKPEDAIFKQILGIDLPAARGGGKKEILLINEKWNQLLEPNDIEVYTLIQISVKQPAVYYPDALLVKYIEA